jgi:hypothetical protein
VGRRCVKGHNSESLLLAVADLAVGEAFRRQGAGIGRWFVGRSVGPRSFGTIVAISFHRPDLWHRQVVSVNPQAPVRMCRCRSNVGLGCQSGEGGRVGPLNCLP